MLLLPGLPVHLHAPTFSHPVAQGAKQDFEVAISIDPTSTEALLHRGGFRLDGGKLQVIRMPPLPLPCLPPENSHSEGFPPSDACCSLDLAPSSGLQTSTT